MKLTRCDHCKREVSNERMKNKAARINDWPVYNKDPNSHVTRRKIDLCYTCIVELNLTFSIGE